MVDKVLESAKSKRIMAAGLTWFRRWTEGVGGDGTGNFVEVKKTLAFVSELQYVVTFD